MKRKSWELKLIFLVLVAVFAIFLAVPAIRLLLKSFLGEDGLTGAYYLDVFSGKGFTTALGNSFAVSIVSALVAVGIAFVMAYIIHYTRLPRGFKRFVQAVATLPMFLPTITYGFAIIYSFGKQGLITRLLGHQFFDIYGFGGLLVGYVIYTVPVAFLLIHNTMGYVDKKDPGGLQGHGGTGPCPPSGSPSSVPCWGPWPAPSSRPSSSASPTSAFPPRWAGITRSSPRCSTTRCWAACPTSTGAR